MQQMKIFGMKKKTLRVISIIAHLLLMGLLIYVISIY